MIRHRLLLRQVRKHFGSQAAVPPECLSFLEDVGAAYEQFDADRRLIERSMEVSSDELFEATQHLSRQNEANAVVLSRLRAIAQELQPDGSVQDSTTQDLLEACDAIEQLVHRRREAEEVMRAARDAAEAGHRAKTEFLATMSHEIRTPMNAIIGFACLLLQRPLAAEERDHVQTIHDSAGKLLAIIDDILDIAKIESGRLHIRPTQVELAACVREAMREFEAPCRMKGIDFCARIASDIPAVVELDRERMLQILAHLLDNAVKFTDRGSIELSVERAHEPGAEHLRFSVRDTGIGIPEDRFDKLFKPFSQIDATATRRYGGAGLGLAIGRRLVELMGGTITVESSPGRGSCFSFTVRAPVPRQNVAKSDAESAAKLDPSLRLLVVEDNPVNTKVLLLTLRKLGLTADTAINGVEALHRLTASDYDAVFMDIQMPEMDGLEATRRLRERVSKEEPPYVMALTANARQEDREACAAAGMHEFISKPVNPEKILSALRRAQAWCRDRFQVSSRGSQVITTAAQQLS